MKQVRAICRIYDNIVDVFHKGDELRLQAEAFEGTKNWDEDGNRVLMQHVLEAFPRFAVAELSKTYAAIPVLDVAQLISRPADSVETYLNSLIANGFLQATITPATPSTPTPVLRFSSGAIRQAPSVQTETDQLARLQRQIQRTEVLAKDVQDANWRLRMQKEYIEHVQKARRSAMVRENDQSCAEEGGTEAMPFVPGGFVQDKDEDIMDDT